MNPNSQAVSQNVEYSEDTSLLNIWDFLSQPIDGSLQMEAYLWKDDGSSL